MDYSRIIGDLHIGSCPRTSEDVDALQHAGITAVVNLQTDEDEAYTTINWPYLQACYQSYGIEVRRVPVRDFDPEDLTAKLPQCVRILQNFSMLDIAFTCIALLERDAAQPSPLPTSIGNVA